MSQVDLTSVNYFFNHVTVLSLLGTFADWARKNSNDQVLMSQWKHDKK